MRYADTLLADGEDILLRRRQHWVALLLDVRAALVLWLVTLAAIVIAAVARPTGAALTLLGLAALVSLVLGLIVFGYHLWRYWAQDFLITTRRVIKVYGIFNKEVLDSSLEKINDAELRQSLLGRLLGYGDLRILTASEAAVDRFHYLHDPVGFKRAMLNAKHQYELEIEGHPPTPPFRAEPPPGSPAASPTPQATDRTTIDRPTTDRPTTDVPAPSAASGAPIDPAPAAPTATDAEQVTRLLGQLADVRERGAITPEEYEAKKAELLARL